VETVLLLIALLYGGQLSQISNVMSSKIIQRYELALLQKKFFCLSELTNVDFPGFGIFTIK
jgi:ABC-type enterochelin transport system permease subunit